MTAVSHRKFACFASTHEVSCFGCCSACSACSVWGRHVLSGLMMTWPCFEGAGCAFGAYAISARCDQSQCAGWCLSPTYCTHMFRLSWLTGSHLSPCTFGKLACKQCTPSALATLVRRAWIALGCLWIFIASVALFRVARLLVVVRVRPFITLTSAVVMVCKSLQ